MKIIGECIVLIVFIMCTYSLQAQGPLMSQYTLDLYRINPAVAGANDQTELVCSYRYQWLGFDNAPQTSFLSGHTPLTKKHKEKEKNVKGYTRFTGGRKKAFGAIGGITYFDQAGAWRENLINISYTYHVPLTSTLKIAAGLSGGVKHLYLDYSKLQFGNPNDPIMNSSDKRWYPEGIAGIWLYTNKFFSGLSVTDLSLQTKRDYKNYYFTAGLEIPINRHIDWVPSILLKASPPSPMQIELNSKFRFYDKVWAGVSIRSDGTFLFLFGAQFMNRISLSYSVDLPYLSEVKRLNATTHEVLIRFTQKRKKVLCFTY